MKKNQREELGKFLRSRRDRLSPRDVGLVSLGRRRSLGLKREEVAQLAGVSLSWYTWMEQGREINFSVDVLNSVLQALQLSPDEKLYAFELCGLQYECHLDKDTLPQSLMKLVDHQEEHPTYIQGRYWNIVYMNQCAYNLFQGLRDAPEQYQNILWYTFVSPDAQLLMDEWETQAKRIVTEFKVDCNKYMDDPFFISFVNKLRQKSIVFDQLWDQEDIQFTQEKRRTFNHPQKGKLTYHYHTLELVGVSDTRLIFYIPE